MIKLAKPALSFVVPTLLALILTSCSTIITPDQPNHDTTITLGSSGSVGQTFLAEYDGLESIDILIKEKASTTGKIHLNLYSDPDKSISHLGNAAINLSDNAPAGYYRFTLPIQIESNNRYHYFEITTEDSETIQIGISDGETYLNGSMYVNNDPIDNQVSFNLNYNPLFASIGLIKDALKWVGIILISLYLFVLPGWALSDALLQNWTNQSIWVKLVISTGISLSVYPVLFLWIYLFGLSLGAVCAWLPSITAILYFAVKTITTFQRIPPKKSAARFTLQTFFSAPRHMKLADWVLIIALIAIVFTRFFPIRNLEAPMWGDSYQHSMITQLLSENMGLFQSWQPYAALTTFTYHFGFHSLATAFHWITGFNAPVSVLWTGQILNILAILSVYPLAIRIGASKWAGVIAVIVAGLLLPMPMTYVNWGRYTQLAALVILPIAIWIFLDIFDTGLIKYKGYVLAWLVLTGLALTHYRILFFALLFFPAFIITYGSSLRYKFLIKQAILICVVSGALFLPWFIHVFGGKIMGIFYNQITTPASQISSIGHQTNAIGDISIYLPFVIWFMLPFIIIWGIWRRDKGIVLLLLWWILILIAANPQWLGLPGSGAITNFAVFISLFIPTSVLIGTGSSWVILRFAFPNNLNKKPITSPGKPHLTTKPILHFSLFIIILVICLWGVGQRLADVQPLQYAMVTRPDRIAFEWIKTTTTSNTRLLVNSFPAYSGYAIAGSDSGWWIPLLARKDTNLPPLNYSFEQGPFPGYREWVNELTIEIFEKGIDDPDVLAMLNEREFTHIFIGQRHGTVGYDGPLFLDPNTLLQSNHYQPIYHADRVWIFEIKDKKQ
jgi:hypothetical protein